MAGDYSASDFREDAMMRWSHAVEETNMKIAARLIERVGKVKGKERTSTSKKARSRRLVVRWIQCLIDKEVDSLPTQSTHLFYLQRCQLHGLCPLCLQSALPLKDFCPL